MSLATGTTLGVYEILAPLGEGGMGEVYRARDTKLNREVALKVVPAEFAADHDRMARFEREAQVLASLNHPNVAAIYGLEESSDTRALVLELVEGKTLAERLAEGPIPVDEAMGMAKQIVEAIEYAHERGVVHRDLKPANIKITPEGSVKVLDFGLAKALGDDPRSAAPTNSPTLSLAATQAGMILGTAAYMSPEQAKGQTVDRRADIWSFGIVLFELLSGRMVFAGETLSETMAQVIMKEPEWALLPEPTPPRIRELLRRCLIKDPRSRLQAIGEARIAIDEASKDPVATSIGAVGVAPVASRRREWIWAAASLVLLAATVGLTIRLVLQPVAEAPMVRFEVSAQNVAAGMPVGLLSPDGRRLALIKASQSKFLIWVHSFDSSTAVPLPGTEGIEPAILMWSPDSRYIGFAAEGKLKKVAVTGGPAQVICNLPPRGRYTGTWSAAGTILLGTVGSRSDAGSPLLRVSPDGGEPVPASELDASRKERVHGFPNFLPDGRHYFFLASGGGFEGLAAFVGTVDSHDRLPLPGIRSEVKYSSSGHILFVREGALMAQRFDTRSLQVSGEAVPIADPFVPALAVTGPFSSSANGMLSFLSSTALEGSQLFWLDRTGKYIAPAGPVGQFNDIELSLDDRHVTFEAGVPGDIWVLDLTSGVTTRVTSDPTRDADPVWASDGKTVAFRADRDGGHLYGRAFGVVGEDQLLLKSDTRDSPSSWSRDGRYLIYDRTNDVWALPLFGEKKPFAVTATSFVENQGQVSPDGRWIAYESNEPGRQEVYVQSFPQPGLKQQISNGGGSIPRWSAGGKELFYLSPDDTLMAVAITPAGNSLSVSAPKALFQMHVTNSTEGNYAVSSTGRFLVNVPSADRSSSPITVVLNWAAGLPK